MNSRARSSRSVLSPKNWSLPMTKRSGKARSIASQPEIPAGMCPHDLCLPIVVEQTFERGDVGVKLRGISSASKPRARHWHVRGHRLHMDVDDQPALRRDVGQEQE